MVKDTFCIIIIICSCSFDYRLSSNYRRILNPQQQIQRLYSETDNVETEWMNVGGEHALQR